MNGRHQKVLSYFQHLGREINNAAILNPDLLATDVAARTSPFFTDSVTVRRWLNDLKNVARDSVNIQIAGKLDRFLDDELSWLLRSNVPDSIIHGQAVKHIASYRKIDSLVSAGIKRTDYLISYRRTQLDRESKLLKGCVGGFILLAGVLLVYTTVSLAAQKQKRKRTNEELNTVLNRISDGIVSVDKQWRYTFLNDASLASHPGGREKAIGKLMWDVHPEIKGTIFWDKYHEAMTTGNITEVESYYPPMDTWFSAKTYPSADGLTIFYKNVTAAKKAEQKINDTLKEISDYKFALDESSIVAITDQKGIIKHANQNFCKISKYTIEELIGKDHRIINSGYHTKEFIRELWRTIASGKIWNGELKNKAKDGTIYWVDTTIIPFLNESGKPYQYMAIRSDITERKKLEEHQALFVSIINSSEDAILSKTLAGIITTWNPGATKLFGYSTEETIGKHISLIIPKNLLGEETEIISRISKGESIDHHETQRLKKDGSLFNVSLTISPIKNSDGEVIGVSKIIQDITSRKENEAKLIKSEKIYKAIASNIPGSVICLLDLDFRYFLIEGDMIVNLGYSKSQLLGRKVQDALSPAINAELIPRFQRVIAGETVTNESVINGYDIISRYIPLRDADDAVYAIMVVAIDVTRLKEAQRSVIELNKDLEKKIAIRTEELRKTNEELEAFSYSVSHDLRAPLRGIVGFGAILEEDYASKLDDEAKRITGVIRNNAMKMGELIDDLLAFSRTGKQALSKTTIDTDNLVNALINDVPASGIDWQVQALPPMHADINTIRQVWVNLISNAVKYSSTQSKPRIEIDSWTEEDKTVYYVKDNGVGFDSAYKHKLFKVFQRLHDADDFEGTGVGLALVEKIISRHGGNVWAEGSENKGACFYFSLPNK